MATATARKRQLKLESHSGTAVICAAKHHQQAMHPKEPTSLDFELDEDFIPPGFLCSDIKIDGEHHFIFATEIMLQLLSVAKNWYIDATFKVVSPLFKPLFSIHTFIKHNSSIKQVPLLFAVMSAKRKKDYKKVLKAVKSMLPSNALNPSK